MENMERAKIVSGPTPETKKIVEDWRKAGQKRREAVDARLHDSQKKKSFGKIEKAESGKTNREIADTMEFQNWCREHGLEPTKRQASQHREEFEKYLASLENKLDKAA